jgi:hypothetical protein
MSKSYSIQFDRYRIGWYRGHRIHRTRRRGNNAGMEYRITGKPVGFFTDLDLVVEEIDYLEAKAASG